MAQPQQPEPSSSASSATQKRRAFPVAEWSLLGGAVCGVLAALGAWLFVPAQYSSTGRIELARHTRPLLAENPPDALVDYEAFAGANIAHLSSERTLDMALMSSLWQQHGRGNSPAVASAFQSHLHISRDGEEIDVTFTDRDPEVAVDAVRSVIDAYEKFEMSDDVQQDRHRLALLQSVRKDILQQIAETQGHMFEISHGETLDSLQSRYNATLQQVRAAETMLDQSRAMVKDFASRDVAPAPGSAAKDAGILPALTARMASATQEYDQIRVELILLNHQITELSGQQQELSAKQALIAKIYDSIQSITIESQRSGRITILSNGDRAVKTSPAPAIATTGTGGFLAGLFLVGLLVSRSVTVR